MNDINDYTFTGRLTRDPELRVLANDNALAEFTVAINRKYGEKEETVFMSVEAWGKLAEIIKNVAAKGSVVLIKGRLKQDTWQGDDGTNRSKILVVANEFLHVRKPRENEHE